jgi:hypothetical protein
MYSRARTLPFGTATPLVVSIPNADSAVVACHREPMAIGREGERFQTLFRFVNCDHRLKGRAFRPTVLARDLSEYDVVNVGAAGTFVVRKPKSRSKFRATLLPKLPFEADVMLCDGRDLLRLESANPFGTQPSPPDVCSFREHSLEGGCRPRIATSFVSLRWPVVGAGDGV